MMGVWMLGLMLLEQNPENLTQQQSIAAAFYAVREAMAGRIEAGRRQLRCVLRAALNDACQRHSSKAARHWPHKKNPKPPGEPHARMAEESEIRWHKN